MVSKPVTLDSFVALAAQKGWSWTLGYDPHTLVGDQVVVATIPGRYQATVEDPATGVEVNAYASDATEAAQMAVDAMARLPDGSPT